MHITNGTDAPEEAARGVEAVPTRYEVTLLLEHLGPPPRFAGEVVIDITVLRVGPVILLHAHREFLHVRRGSILPRDAGQPTAASEWQPVVLEGRNSSTDVDVLAVMPTTQENECDAAEGVGAAAVWQPGGYRLWLSFDGIGEDDSVGHLSEDLSNNKGLFSFHHIADLSSFEPHPTTSTSAPAAASSAESAPTQPLPAAAMNSDSPSLVESIDAALEAWGMGPLSVDEWGLPVLEQTARRSNSRRTVWGVATSLEPIFCRRLFPCFDEPHHKVEMELTLAYPCEVFELTLPTPSPTVPHGAPHRKPSPSSHIVPSLNTPSGSSPSPESPSPSSSDHNTHARPRQASAPPHPHRAGGHAPLLPAPAPAPPTRVTVTSAPTAISCTRVVRSYDTDDVCALLFDPPTGEDRFASRKRKRRTSRLGREGGGGVLARWQQLYERGKAKQMLRRGGSGVEGASTGEQHGKRGSEVKRQNTGSGHDIDRQEERQSCSDGSSPPIPPRVQAMARRSITNTSTSTAAYEGKYRVVVFEPTPRLPCYAYGFYIGHFGSLGGRVEVPVPANTPGCAEGRRTVDVTAWMPHGRGSGLRFAHEVGMSAFGYFENTFGGGLGDGCGVPYALSKLDLLGIKPHRGIGLENFGCITFDIDFFSVSDLMTGWSRRRRISRLICHEVSHMWFGDCLTPHTFDELFLKEGVARYLEFVALDDILFGSPASRPPQEQLTARNWVWVTFLLEVFFEAMLDDSTGSTHPVALEGLDGVDSIISHFNLITYGKAACIFRTIEGLTSRQAVMRAFQLWMARHQYASTTRADLVACMQGAMRDHCRVHDHQLPAGVTEASLADMFESWVTTTRCPRVTIRLDGVEERDGGLVARINFSQSPIAVRSQVQATHQAIVSELTQRAAAAAGAAAAAASDPTPSCPPRPVPLFFRLNGRQHTFILTDESTTVSVPLPVDGASNDNRGDQDRFSFVWNSERFGYCVGLFDDQRIWRAVVRAATTPFSDGGYGDAELCGLITDLMVQLRYLLLEFHFFSKEAPTITPEAEDKEHANADGCDGAVAMDVDEPPPQPHDDDPLEEPPRAPSPSLVNSGPKLPASLHQVCVEVLEDIARQVLTIVDQIEDLACAVLAPSTHPSVASDSPVGRNILHALYIKCQDLRLTPVDNWRAKAGLPQQQRPEASVPLFLPADPPGAFPPAECHPDCCPSLRALHPPPARQPQMMSACLPRYCVPGMAELLQAARTCVAFVYPEGEEQGAVQDDDSW